MATARSAMPAAQKWHSLPEVIQYESVVSRSLAKIGGKKK